MNLQTHFQHLSRLMSVYIMYSSKCPRIRVKWSRHESEILTTLPLFLSPSLWSLIMFTKEYTYQCVPQQPRVREYSRSQHRHSQIRLNPGECQENEQERERRRLQVYDLRVRTRRVFQSRVRQTLMKLWASSHTRFTGDHDTAGGSRLSSRSCRKQTRIAQFSQWGEVREGRWGCLYGDCAYDRPR